MKDGIKIIRAAANNAAAAEALFEIICGDSLPDAEMVGWRRGIYPSRADIDRDIAAGELYAAVTENGEIAGVITANADMTDGYDSIPWRSDAPRGEAFSVHRLAVHPGFRRLGIARALMRHAETLAREHRRRVIRLDTLAINTRAIEFYKSCGYTYLGVFDIGYGQAHGLYEFSLFEKEII